MTDIGDRLQLIADKFIPVFMKTGSPQTLRSSAVLCQSNQSYGRNPYCQGLSGAFCDQLGEPLDDCHSFRRRSCHDDSADVQYHTENQLDRLCQCPLVHLPYL